MNKDSDNKDSANDAGGKGDSAQGGGQAKKRGHPFILGNPMPALGDYSATKKFMMQIKGEPVVGTDSSE